jgi:hypothetical protein
VWDQRRSLESGCYCVGFEVREELAAVKTGGMGGWQMQGMFQDAVQGSLQT